MKREGKPNDGFDAMGHPVPSNRLSAAYTAYRDMVPNASTEEAMTAVGRFAELVERDEPFNIVGKVGDPSGLDLTGRYRILATLCTEPTA